MPWTPTARRSRASDDHARDHVHVECTSSVVIYRGLKLSTTTRRGALWARHRACPEKSTTRTGRPLLPLRGRVHVLRRSTGTRTTTESNAARRRRQGHRRSQTSGCWQPTCGRCRRRYPGRVPGAMAFECVAPSVGIAAAGEWAPHESRGTTRNYGDFFTLPPVQWAGSEAIWHVVSSV